ncbi:MAG: GtrA family protein [Minisyncoccota bacterium]
MFYFAKFFMVGVLNTAIDFAVLNVLIFLFGMGAHGELYGAFKAVSFMVSATNSYFLNKYWVFEKTDASGAKEPLLFLAVSGVGLLLNVALSSLVFLALTRGYHVSIGIAVNIGALGGTLIVLAWNFIGYKFFVFKKQSYE